MKKYQAGVALSGLVFWGFILIMVAVLGMKVTPSAIEYFKIVKDIKAVAAQAGPNATVADIRASFDRFADVDQLDFPSKQLIVYKDQGRVVVDVAYEKRVHLFYNVSLLIEYKGSSRE